MGIANDRVNPDAERGFNFKVSQSAATGELCIDDKIAKVNRRILRACKIEICPGIRPEIK